MSLKSIISKQSLKAVGIGAVIMAAVALTLSVGGCGKEKKVETEQQEIAVAESVDESADESAAQSRVCNIEEGPFTDARDGKTYRTVKIGDLLWMAENLNYAADSSWCFENKTANCDKYGRLYTWNAAMKSCPEGWRLADSADWANLRIFVGGHEIAGKKLKAKSGWQNNRGGRNGNGMDEYGFSALPGGSGHSEGFFNTNYPQGRGYWWTAEKNSGQACYWVITWDTDGLFVGRVAKEHIYSVRCVCG